jgi:DNA-binding NtrC family response regulator
MSASETFPQIILVEDEPPTLSTLVALATSNKLEPVAFEKAQDAIKYIQSTNTFHRIVGVITDLSTGGDKEAGWGVILAAYELSHSLDLAVYSAYADKQSIPYKLNLLNPAFTLLPKGEGLTGWQDVTKYIANLRRKWESARELAYDDDTKKTYEERAKNYASSSLPILILGETGTGKELLARRIEEFDREQRHEAAAIQTINCGALEPTLAFSELFGYTKGAFTDAVNHVLGKVLEASGYKAGLTHKDDYIEWLKTNPANIMVESDGMWTLKEAQRVSGTLFLDEVATLPQHVMPGLLRVLDTKDVMPLGYHGRPLRALCRIISATNEASVFKETRFRRDLFYRIAGAVLTLPPLRERKPDVIEDFVKDKVWGQLVRKDISVQRKDVTDSGLRFIKELYLDRADDTARAYQEGNFRSLLNLMHRAALMAKEKDLNTIDAPLIKTAVDDGMVFTAANEELDQSAHIRQVFWNTLRKQKGVSIPEEAHDSFGLSDLKEWTRKYQIETAEAFLHCNLVPRIAGTKREKYYELREIETALATGYGRGAWIGGTLTIDHVKEAATRLHRCTADELVEKKISEIVKIVRLKEAEVTGANPESQT